MAKAHVYKRDHINTDEIIPARYLNTDNEAELAKHCMEDLDTNFVKKLKPGDIIVAGDDFGCGSSREHAVWAIRGAKVGCVIASLSHGFFTATQSTADFMSSSWPMQSRKSTTAMKLKLIMKKVLSETKPTATKIAFKPLPDFALEIIANGGLLEHIKKKDSKITFRFSR